MQNAQFWKQIHYQDKAQNKINSTSYSRCFSFDCILWRKWIWYKTYLALVHNLFIIKLGGQGDQCPSLQPIPLPSWCTLTPTQSRWYTRVTYSKLDEGATLAVKHTWGNKLRCTVDRTHAVHILDHQDMKTWTWRSWQACMTAEEKWQQHRQAAFPFPSTRLNQQHKDDCTPWLSPKSLLWKEKSDLPKIMCCIDTICIVNTYLLEEYTPTLIYKQLTEVSSIPAS